MKILVDLNGPALTWDKKPVAPEKPSIGGCLAAMILSQQTKPGIATQLVLWCFKLGEKQPLELDEAQFKMLYDIVDESQTAAIIRGQILFAMDEAKDMAKKEQ